MPDTIPIRSMVAIYTPPKPLTDEIASLHDRFHGNGYYLSAARREGNDAEIEKYEAESERLGKIIDDKTKAIQDEVDKATPV